MIPIIGYLGMTHLGLISAVAAAEKGFETIGFDVDPILIENLQAGNLPVIEPSLSEFLNKNKKRLSFSCRAEDLKRCDIVYCAPDVPTDDLGESDLRKVEKLI